MTFPKSAAVVVAIPAALIIAIGPTWGASLRILAVTPAAGAVYVLIDYIFTDDRE